MSSGAAPIQDAKQWPGYGVDVLRLWTASTEYSTDITLGPVIVGPSPRPAIPPEASSSC